MERTEQQTVEDKTEAIARRLARQAGQPESLWVLFLSDAYREMFPDPPDSVYPTEEKENG